MKNKSKKRLGIDGTLALIVLLTVLRQFFLGNYHNMFLGILTLILFAIPKIIDKRLDVSIPVALETIILFFIFAAEILGEINAFYIKIPLWDTILHTVNGFLMSAIGFALIDIFNRNERFTTKMSPYFVGFTAFCFSMTVGVLWEFYEFFMDLVFKTDMQKDWIIDAINTVKLHPDSLNVPVRIDVHSVYINGEDLGLGGYLDIGLIDTMKDLLVNLFGAVVFSIIGVFYLKHKGKGKFAAAFIPVVRKKAKKDKIGNNED